MKPFIKIIIPLIILTISIISCGTEEESTEISGCTYSNALNYNANATLDDGSCVFLIEGCTDTLAINYDPQANFDDGSCEYPLPGCTDPNAVNYNPEANQDDGTCEYTIKGCTDPNALNYNPNVEEEDGSCEYLGDKFIGEYIGEFKCSSIVDLISTDTLSLSISYGVQGPGEFVAVTFNNIGMTLPGIVSGNVIFIDSVVPGLQISDPPIAVDLIFTGMPSLIGATLNGDLNFELYSLGTIGINDPLTTGNCVLDVVKQ